MRGHILEVGVEAVVVAAGAFELVLGDAGGFLVSAWWDAYMDRMIESKSFDIKFKQPVINITCPDGGIKITPLSLPIGPPLALPLQAPVYLFHSLQNCAFGPNIIRHIGLQQAVGVSQVEDVHGALHVVAQEEGVDPDEALLLLEGENLVGGVRSLK